MNLIQSQQWPVKTGIKICSHIDDISPVTDIRYFRIEFRYKWLCYPLSPIYGQKLTCTIMQNNISPNIDDGLNFVICEQTFNVGSNFFRYNSGAKSFSEITSTKHISVSIDAVTIQNQYWQKKNPPAKKPHTAMYWHTWITRTITPCSLLLYAGRMKTRNVHVRMRISSLKFSKWISLSCSNSWSKFWSKFHGTVDLTWAPPFPSDCMTQRY